MSAKSLISLAVGAAFLGGCSLIPDFELPESPIAKLWPSGPAYGEAAKGSAEKSAPADIGWRDFFTDARLQRLIETALANNRDMRIAALNVEAARAQYQIQRADLFPSVGASAGGTVQRVPADLSSAGRAMVSRQYSVAVGITSYELDLFGRIRSLNQVALEQYMALDETRVSTQIALVAEVASAYFTLLGDEELLKLTRETLESQKHSFDLTRQSRDNGVATELDLRQVETSVHTAEANLAQYVRQVAQDRNALALLIGQPLSEDIDLALSSGPGLDDAALVADLPAGVPSAVLERRPDIRSAEHALRGANANIGAARAAFFPSLSLTANAGLSSASLDNLFMGSARAWTFSPSLSVPIFQGGRLEANLDYAQVSKRIEVATYEKAIQTAFREVADALAARGTIDDQMAAERALVEASSVRYRLSEMRFRSGVEGYLSTLDAQRSLYSVQQSLITTRLARLVNLVTLYKVMGGGWTETASATPAQ